jgi:DUF4097 and DUF4098 domain-containing protein YvlB
MRDAFATPLAALLLAGVAAAQERVDQTRPAAADGLVEIDNPAGSVRVTGWDRNEVSVSGTLGRGAEGIDLQSRGRRTSISVEGHDPHSAKSTLEVRVPAKSHVRIESVDGSFVVAGVTGVVEAENVNGSIAVSGAAEVDATSVNGGVEVTGASLRARAESVNGPVTVKNAGGSVQASTVNGRLIVAGGRFERVELETVSGALLFEGDLAERASLDAETVSGAVELVLPASIGADFSVSSFSGEIDNGLGPPARDTSRYTSEKELSFSTGKGGASVTIHTLSGDVTIRKR